MKTNTSNWMRRLAGITALLMVFTSFVGQASARILFQDDTNGVFESENLNIGSNDAGANNTSIKFGADGTAAENGNILWNIGTNTFSVDHTVDVTGGLSATGLVNFSGASGMRVREVAGITNPGTACTNVGELIMDTSDQKLYVCTNAGTDAWTTVDTAAAAVDFEAVYSTDANKTLSVTDNLATGFAINEGANNYMTVVTTNGSEAVQINEDAVIGDGGDTVAVNSSDWDISTTGAVTGIASVASDDNQATLNTNIGVTGADAGAHTMAFQIDGNTAISVAATGDGAGGVGARTVQIGVSGAADTVTIGDANAVVGVTSATWNISTAGAATGLTGITSTGTANFSGTGAFRTREVAGITNPGTACTTTGEVIMDTNDNTLYVCTNAGTDAWTKVNAGGDATTLDTLDSTQFLRSDTNDSYTSGTLTFDNGTTLTVNGVANIGDGGDNIAINSNSWDVSTGGAFSGVASIAGADNQAALNTNLNVTGADAGAHTLAFQIDGNSALTIAATGDGAGGVGVRTVTIGASAQADVVAIGDANAVVSVDSATWDISSAGAISGVTTIGASGNITTSGGTFIVGTTALNETTAANDSGAFLVGTFDEFDNSASTNVQDVLDDLDAKIGSNAPNVNELTFYPEYPDVVVYKDTTNNNGTLVSDYDSGNSRQYYGWTSGRNALNDIDLRFRYELPADFVATGDLTLQLRTLTTAAADNKIDLVLRNDTDNTTCATSAALVGAVANTWEVATVTAATINAGCAGGNTLAAGDIIEIQVKNYAKNTGEADVGKLQLDYTN